MRIQHNIAALNSYRQLGNNNSAVSKNLEKLSSGYRINRAGDDAAGLAISEKMRAQITGLDTAQKNAQDGISLVQTAEGALTEVHSMLNRMVELATQSANGTYDNDVDRANIQKEVDSLKEEIDRIAESSNYNGIKLLDGSLSGASSAGGLTGAPIATYKGSTGTVAAQTIAVASIDCFQKDTINVDGTEIQVDWSKLTDDEKNAIAKDWTLTSGAVTANDAKKAAGILEDTINAAIEKYNSENGTSINKITVEATTNTGVGLTSDTTAKGFKFTSGQKDGNSKITFTTASDGTGANAGVNSVLGKVIGQAQTFTGGVPEVSLSISSHANEIGNGSFTMKLGDQAVTVTLGAFSGTDTAGQLETLVQNGLDNALQRYDEAHNLTGDEAMSGKLKVKINADGALEFTNTTGQKISFEDEPRSEVAKILGISTEGKAAASGGLVLQVGDTSDDFQQVTVKIDNMSSESLDVAGINVSNQLGAKSAIDKIKKAINTVSSTRGDLGAIQNRLDHTINNLGVTSENMTAAESRIRDVDMAKEMMDFTKNNILSQASQAMLAQANQIPQGVLQLLQ